MRASESPFERYMSERILSFAYLMCPSVSGPKALKNVSAVRNIFEVGLKKYGVFVQKSLSLKKYFERKHSQTIFVVYVLIIHCQNLGAIGQIPMRFSFLQCPLHVKKLIRESNAKYVNQTGNFYFRPKLKTAISLPVFSLFQWFLFCIRGFIWIITLTEKSKFEENCRSEA